MSPTPETAGVIAVLAIAGFLQGLTGFGFGLVSMALLPLLISFRDALVVVAILNLLACLMTFATTFRQFSWRDGAGLVIGSAIGVPIGFYALVHLGSEWLLRGLGLVMCLFAASELFLTRRHPLLFPRSAGLPVGLISGSLGGAFNIGGPPVIAYVYSQPWAKEKMIATLQVVFGVSALLRLYLVHAAGLMTTALVSLAMLSVLPMLLAIFAGGKLLNRVPRELLKMGVFIFLLAIGAKYLFLTPNSH